MKAQITNMSAADNAGFKSEYHVKLFFFLLFFETTKPNFQY